jgi:hypothetical protein
LIIELKFGGLFKAMQKKMLLRTSSSKVHAESMSVMSECHSWGGEGIEVKAERASVKSRTSNRFSLDLRGEG